MSFEGKSNNRDILNSQLIYKGQCINNDDPMRLGRIRAILKTENQDDRETANENFGKQTYRNWDEKDPFVFKPLLPFFINTPPKKDEYVHLFYNNIKRKGSKDKYYIGGVYSSPTTSNVEVYDSSVTNLDEGSRNKPFPNLLNEDGEYFIKDSKGIYADPNDVTLYGRGCCDIVIKDDTVLLRAGKNKNFQVGQTPRKNEKRAFLQLSKFESRTIYGTPEKKFIFNSEDKNLKSLIEYDIINPENQESKFRGNIYIYNLSQQDGLSVSTKSISVNLPIPESSKSLMTKISFSSKSVNQVKTLINKVLEGFVKGSISSILVNETTPSSLTGELLEGLSNFDDNENVLISGPQRFDQGGTFPFYFRPQKSLYKLLNGVNSSTNPQVVFNVGSIISQVSIKPTDGPSKGYSLVYDKNKTDSVPFKPTKQNVVPKKVVPFNKSVGILGGDEIYLLSHKSQKSGIKGKINLSGTLYGINENLVADEIEPKTSSMVRGEELIDLLNLIVRFLTGHVHAYPGLEPIKQSSDGVTVDKLLEELLNAQDKILNKNIRIN